MSTKRVGNNFNTLSFKKKKKLLPIYILIHSPPLTLPYVGVTEIEIRKSRKLLLRDFYPLIGHYNKNTEKSNNRKQRDVFLFFLFSFNGSCSNVLSSLYIYIYTYKKIIIPSTTYTNRQYL